VNLRLAYECVFLVLEAQQVGGDKYESRASGEGRANARRGQDIG
jgi:hypothetical protein